MYGGNFFFLRVHRPEVRGLNVCDSLCEFCHSASRVVVVTSRERMITPACYPSHRTCRVVGSGSSSAAAGWQPGSARQGSRTGMGRSGRLLSNQGFMLVFFASPLIFSYILICSPSVKTKNNKYVVKVVLRDKVDYVSGFDMT